MKNIVVIGGGGHAKVLICILKKCGYNVIGYTDNIDHGETLGVRYLGDDSSLKELPAGQCTLAAIGIGTVSVNDKRQKLKEDLEKLGFQFPPIISPHSIVNENVFIGKGTVVFDGAIVNTGTVIGEGCIVNTGTIVEHDCIIGDFVHLAPGVTLSGGVKIGNHTLIGVGATVIQNRNITDNCLIGAGATVTADCRIPGKYLGTPAKIIE